MRKRDSDEIMVAEMKNTRVISSRKVQDSGSRNYEIKKSTGFWLAELQLAAKFLEILRTADSHM